MQAVSIATSELRHSTRERAKSALNLLFAEPPIPTKDTYEQNPQGRIESIYLEGDDADQDAKDEEDECDDEPDDTPHFVY